MRKDNSIGFCGAHCTGKTTLSADLSELLEIPFTVTSSSAVMIEMGLPPDQPMSFADRLRVQEKILDVAEDLWSKSPTRFISDRTPLDMLAYTLAEIRGDTEYDAERLATYIARCRALTNKYFSYIILLQPGIPLVEREGKAALNEGYICHLNSLLLGITGGEHIESEVFWMPVITTDLDERLNVVVEWLEEYGVC